MKIKPLPKKTPKKKPPGRPVKKPSQVGSIPELDELEKNWKPLTKAKMADIKARAEKVKAKIEYELKYGPWRKRSIRRCPYCGKC